MIYMKQRKIDLEQYYTKESIAKKIVDIVHDKYNIDSFDIIIESSSGTGVFIKQLLETSNNIKNKLLYYDIDPRFPGTIKCDYLEHDIIKDINNINNNAKKIIVIGNPPFGRQSCLLKKFIKKSCMSATVVAFILPCSFKKNSMIKSFPLNFHKEYEIDLPLNSFILNNTEYSVPCIFQIWIKKDYNRILPKKEYENDTYSFTTKDDCMFSFRRVGALAGKFEFDREKILSLSKESNYFIKINHENNILKDDLDKIIWKTNNTVAAKSISKQELIYELNKIIR